MLYDYKWEEDVNLSQHAPMCRSRVCTRAHFKNKEPRRKMVALIISKPRTFCNWVWFCNHCKRIVRVD